MQTPIKVVLVGNAKSGKTSATRTLLGDNALQNYVPTLGVEVHPYRTPSKAYNIWDCAGNPNFGGLRSGYWINANVVIIFHGGVGTKSPQQWESEVRNIAPNATYLHLAPGALLAPLLATI